jgi:hypothetical protein
MDSGETKIAEVAWQGLHAFVDWTGQDKQEVAAVFLELDTESKSAVLMLGALMYQASRHPGEWQQTCPDWEDIIDEACVVLGWPENSVKRQILRFAAGEEYLGLGKRVVTPGHQRRAAD